MLAFLIDTSTTASWRYAVVQDLYSRYYIGIQIAAVLTKFVLQHKKQ